MKELLKTNCYDTSDTMVIMGSCLPRMSPKAFEEVKQISEDIYQVCLEETHLNMVITKITGMLSRSKIKRLVFVTVDKSPHCVQLHYIVKELEKIMNLSEIQIENYVVEEDKLVLIPIDIIGLSKNLAKLKKNLEN